MLRNVITTIFAIGIFSLTASADPHTTSIGGSGPSNSQPMMMNGQHIRGTTPVEMTCYSKNYKKAYKLTGDKQLADGTACHLCHMNC